MPHAPRTVHLRLLTFLVFRLEHPDGGGSGTSSLATDTKGATGADYSSPTSALTLFSSPTWANFYCDATYGEVRVYDEYYGPTSATYSNIMTTLEAKWLTP
jgi:hypothetical protein